MKTEYTCLSVAIACCLVVSLCTLSTLWKLFPILARREKDQETYRPLLDRPQIYRNPDGSATQESTRAFRKSQAIGYCLTPITIVGLILSVLETVLSLRYPQRPQQLPRSRVVKGEMCLNLASWSFLIVQSLGISFVLNANLELVTLNRKALLTISFLFMLISGILRVVSYPAAGFITNLRYGELGLSAAGLLVWGSIPRHPQLYTKTNAEVDNENTVSWLKAFAFAWVNPCISLIQRDPNIEIDDLPYPDSARRSETLETELRAHTGGRLWAKVVKLRFMAVMKLVAMNLVLCVTSFAPQLALLAFLKALESRSGSGPGNSEPWIWIPVLGVTVFAASASDAWLLWMAISKLSIPIYAQLAAATFSKATRLENVTTQRFQKSHATKDNQEPQESEEAANMVTLAAVDARHVSEFAAYSPMVPLTVLKLVIACVFLFYLIGWESTLAVIGTYLLTLPLNAYLSQKYYGRLAQQMKVRDSKTHLITELLHGMRQIKLSALEGHWRGKVMALREVELSAQWALFLWECASLCVWILGPLLLSLVALSVYFLVHGCLTPSVAFTTLAIMDELETWLVLLPYVITLLLQALNSLKRVQTFLELPEVPSMTGQPGQNDIELEETVVRWPGTAGNANDNATLNNINIKLTEGKFHIVVGSTGSGKSLFLSAIIGESQVLGGTIRRPVLSNLPMKDDWLRRGALAYVPQTPWIESGTLRDNILFGLPLNHGRYDKVLSACALWPDLRELQEGDQTQVGPNGVNLSGGQKWRLALGRALYSRASILILDDVLSAVDTQTGRHLITHALTGELVKERTLIMATHHASMCSSEVDNVFLVSTKTVKQIKTSEISKYTSPPSDEARQPSTDKGTTQAKDANIEGRNTGRFQIRTFYEFWKTGSGLTFTTFILLLTAGCSALWIINAWWINIWTDESSNDTDDHTTYYLKIYAALLAISWVAATARYFVFQRVNINASRRLFVRFCDNIMRINPNWFNKHPVGRILNRFTSDFDSIDTSLGKSFGSVTYSFMQVVTVLCALSLVSPMLIIVSLALSCISIYYCHVYVTAGREIKRLEGTTRSPVLDLFVSATNGITTIRAFGKVSDYVEKMQRRIDQHTQASWHLALLNAWLKFRMSIIGAVCASFTVLFILLTGGSAALGGFGISLSFQLTAAIDTVLRMYAKLELDMNSMERVMEYMDLPVEARDGSRVPASWPARGLVEVRGLTASYEPNGVPILKNLTFKLPSGKRVGVVGRTGAGKSSLGLALFRFLEVTSGTIHIDGVDISKIAVETLRSRLAIVPQDPFLFAGTLRFNLDPDGLFTDEELLAILDKIWSNGTGEHNAELGSISSPSSETTRDQSRSFYETNNRKKFKNRLQLETKVVQGGANMSHGERQLICLARALVRRPKLLILDEATSAIDTETDTQIQRLLSDAQSIASDASMLVIAHRIRTVADFDYILCMHNGEAVEFGTPAHLLLDSQASDGYFRGLVEESGDREIEKMIRRSANQPWLPPNNCLRPS